MGIRENIDSVREDVEKATLRAGRDPADVRIIAVSKGFATEDIKAAAACGLTEFGESYAQEFRRKFHELAELEGGSLSWHFIGNIQPNKVKYLVGRVALIHSLESLKVAAELERRSAVAGVITRCLIEVNLTEEAHRHGVPEHKLESFISAASGFKHLALQGFMTMAPYSENPESSRLYFRRLREIRDEYISLYPSLTELSMGMSSDFTVAVEEGATYVRVGTRIFGERVPRKPEGSQ